MSTSRNHGSEPCGHEDCGSRRFHIGGDGYTYCDRGHQQSERGAVIAEDTGELVTTGRRARRRDSDAESGTSRASSFSGARAFEHYLLCLQLVLRKQLRWLIEVQRLPEELEVVVHDLWALRLQKLRTRVSYDSDTETEGRSQYFSSQSEGATSASEASRRSRKRTRVKTDGSPNLIETLCLCYTGFLLLREPVTVADILAWTNSGQLLYYRASRAVPLGMRERLPATYQDLLEPQQMMRREKLHRGVMEVLARFASDHGMAVPPLNHTLVLYRWLRELALPIEAFAATQRLARLLDLDFGFRLEVQSGAKDLPLRYPEARLMAMLVVATKLLFPFDGVSRYPASANDLSALSLDWSVWAELQTKSLIERQQSNHISYEEAANMSQANILQAADERLDRYMDWFESNIASEAIREHGRPGQDADFRRTLVRLFPARKEVAVPVTAASDETSTHIDHATKTLRQMQSTLGRKRIVDGDEGGEAVARVGSFYGVAKRAEDLDGPVKLFYERAAELAGLTLESMVRAVVLIERKMQIFEEKLRKSDG